MRRRGNISKRCMVCIMSAMMMMSSVTGTMIAPMGAYAVGYETTDQVPEDTDGHRNLASEDTLDVNDGTIHENRGTIRENNGTVEDNNSGTVVSNSGTVNWGNVTTNESSGTVVAATVTDNYGTATEDSIVTNNYALAVNSTVTDNWASGTVSGTSLVTNNHGGTIDGNDVTVTHDLGTDPGPNPPVSEVKPINNPTDTISDVPSDTTNPEDNNDQPQPKVKKTNDGYVSELVNEIDNELKISGRYEKINIHFKNRDNLTVDELRTLLFYTPSNVTIHCTIYTNNCERYELYIYPRSLQSTIDEKGNGVWATDWESVYHSCLDELSKEKGKLAGPNRIVEIFNDFHIACRLDHSEAPDAPKPQDPPRSDIQDISIQLDQLQTAAITNAKAQTTAITNANAANVAIASAVDTDAAFFAAVDMQCDNYLIETNALIEEGKIDEANALIAKGLTINAGTHQGFKAATLAKLGEASRMGIAVTVNFTYGGADYSVTIPGNSQIDPGALTDENGYCNFTTLLTIFR